MEKSETGGLSYPKPSFAFLTDNRWTETTDGERMGVHTRDEGTSTNREYHVQQAVFLVGFSALPAQ